MDRDVNEPVPYPKDSKFWGSRYVNKILDRADVQNDGVDETQFSPVVQRFRGASTIAGVARRIVSTVARTWFIARTTDADVLQRGSKVIALPAGDARPRAASIFLSDEQGQPRSVAFPLFAASNPRQRDDGSFVVDPPVDLATDSPIATQCFIPATMDAVDVWELPVVMSDWDESDSPVIRGDRPTRLMIAPRRSSIDIAVAYGFQSGANPVILRQNPGDATIFTHLLTTTRIVFRVTPSAERYMQLLVVPTTKAKLLSVIEVQAV